MPRSTQAFPAKLGMDHNPLQTLLFDPTSVLLGAAGNLTLPNLEGLLESSINKLLQDIDNVTGLNFLGLAETLEGLFGGGQDLLLALIDSIPLLGPIVSALNGTTPLTELSAVQQELVEFLLNSQSVAQNAQSLATALNSLLSNAINLLIGWESTLVNTAIGTIENVLPWTVPFIIEGQTTITDLANYITALTPKTELQKLQDNIYNGLLGNTGASKLVGATETQLAAALQQVTNSANSATSIAQQAWNYVLNFVSEASDFIIPATNVGVQLGLGAAGAPGIAGQVQAFLDATAQGLGLSNVVGNTTAQISAYASGIASLLGFNPVSAGAIPGSTTAITQTNNAYIAQRAANAPPWQSIDPTAVSTFPISTLWNISTLPTCPVTSTQSLMGFMLTGEAGQMESIQWIGSGTTNITSMVFNVYSFNPQNGLLSLMFTTANFIGTVEDEQVFNSYPLPEAQFFNYSQSNWFVAEMCVIGSGTYEVVGFTNNAALTHPTAIPPVLGASRSAAAPLFDSAGTSVMSNAASGTVNWTQNIGNNQAEAVIAVVQAFDAPSSLTCTCGGVAMTALTSEASGFSNTFYFTLQNPPTGNQTMAAIFAGASGFIATSVSYYNVSSIGTLQATTGSAAGAAQSVTAAANETVVNVFSGLSIDSSGWPTGFQSIFNYQASTGGNLRNNVSQVFDSNEVLNVIAIGDAPGAATVTFTANYPTDPTGSSTYQTAAAALPLTGIVLSPPPTSPPFTFANVVPYFAFGGSPSATQYIPDLTGFSSSGSYEIPQWATNFDLIAFGGGGGGGAGFAQGTDTLNGGGGVPGAISATTVTAAQLAGFSSLNVQVGGGGGPGIYNGGNGGNAGPSIVSLPNGTSLVSAGGGGGGAGGGSFVPGGGPGNITYNGPAWTGSPSTYFGGPTANSFQGGGNAPGGAGCGGDDASDGGIGANGEVWILAYV